MIRQEELEKAKDAMAEGILATWRLYGDKPSDSLRSILDEYPDISSEIWLSTLKRIQDPLLVRFVIQYLNLTYDDEISKHQNENEKYVYSWRDYAQGLGTLIVFGGTLYIILTGIRVMLSI